MLQGISEVGGVRRGKAVRCATFNSSPLEERHLVTGDFSGGLAVWDVDDLVEPVQEVTGAHTDLIHSLTGTAGLLVSGGREGMVKVWDRRDLRRSVLSMEGEGERGRAEVWTVEAGPDCDSVCAGYSNGDVRLFDCKAGKVRWQASLAKGVTSLNLLTEDRLVGGSVGGNVVVWDLTSDQRTDTKLESNTVWSAVASPHDESVVVATLGSGAIHLLSLTRAHLTKLTSHQSSDKPLTTWTWSRDKPGLGLATGFDQNIRVVIVTNIQSRD